MVCGNVVELTSVMTGRSSLGNSSSSGPCSASGLESGPPHWASRSRAATAVTAARSSLSRERSAAARRRPEPNVHRRLQGGDGGQLSRQQQQDLISISYAASKHVEFHSAPCYTAGSVEGLTRLSVLYSDRVKGLGLGLA